MNAANDEGFVQRSVDEDSGAWRIVAGGVLAVLVTPYLVEIAGGGDEFLLAASFGALVGACDAMRAEAVQEIALRTALGIVFGIVLGATVLASTGLAAVCLGVALVLSRWSWFRGHAVDVGWAVVGGAMAAAGMWFVPAATTFPIGGSMGASLPALLWGICAGVGAMALDIPRLRGTPSRVEEAEDTAFEQGPKPSPSVALPEAADGAVGHPPLERRDRECLT